MILLTVTQATRKIVSPECIIDSTTVESSIASQVGAQHFLMSYINYTFR
jgi:hypothetical protein